MATLQDITAWAAEIETKICAEQAKHVTQTKLIVDTKGKKYIRIIARDVWDGKVNENSGRSYCFIDLATGNILKSESWSKPAKGARGNIADANGSWGKGVNSYGAAYAR